MTEQPGANSAANSSSADISTAEKDPNEWVTGDEPMTGPQKSYLSTLAQQVGEQAPADDLSKADASKAIEDLQARRDGAAAARSASDGRSA